MDSKFVREATAAESADAVIYAINGNAVKFSFPLKGFDKAYAALPR
jgi:hypothetical protein